MEKSFNLTVSELTLAAIIRVLADYLEPKTEDSSSWDIARDDMVIDTPKDCIKQILAVLDYVNPPLYGLLLASVHGYKLSASDLEALLGGEDDDDEEEHNVDA